MTAGGRLEVAAQARANVARAIDLLERPGVAALEQSAVELMTAVARVQQIQCAGADYTGSGGALKSELLSLRGDLCRVRLLLSYAWEFRVGLTGQAGYSNRGALTLPAAATGRCLLEA
jgi:hypothetical protein